MAEGGAFVPVKCVLVKCDIVKIPQNSAFVALDDAGELIIKSGAVSVHPHLPEYISQF